MSNNLKHFREKKGFTRPQLAQAIGIDRTLVWRYEKGLTQPRDEIKIRIAKVLEASVEDVFFSQTVA